MAPNVITQAIAAAAATVYHFFTGNVLFLSSGVSFLQNSRPEHDRAFFEIFFNKEMLLGPHFLQYFYFCRSIASSVSK